MAGKIESKPNGLIWILVIGTFFICVFHLLCFSGVFSYWHETQGETLIDRYSSTAKKKYDVDSGQDVGIYYRYAQNILHNQLPYRDFSLEYPPLSPPIMLFPALFVNDQVSYTVLFGLEMFLFSCAMGIVVFRFIKKNRPSTLPMFVLLFLLSLLLFGEVVVARLDAVPTFVTVLATYLILSRPVNLKNVALISAVAAIGFAIKLFPVLVLLPFGIYLLIRGKWRELLTMTISFILVSLIFWGPALAVSREGVLESFLYHTARGLQIESVLGLPFWIKHIFTSNTPIVFNYGALHFAIPLADKLAKFALFGFALFAIAVVTFLVFRLSKTRKHQKNINPILAFSILSLVIGFVVVNKAFSPQYMIWILWLSLLFIPFFKNKGFWVLLLCIQAATFIIFPILYGDLVNGYTFAVSLLIMRNLAMIGILCWTVVLLVKETSEANWHIVNNTV